ncbi:unnamed protein product [Sympodiomycopsis kandeliae]
MEWVQYPNWRCHFCRNVKLTSSALMLCGFTVELQKSPLPVGLARGRANGSAPVLSSAEIHPRRQPEHGERVCYQSSERRGEAMFWSDKFGDLRSATTNHDDDDDDDRNLN